MIFVLVKVCYIIVFTILKTKLLLLYSVKHEDNGNSSIKVEDNTSTTTTVESDFGINSDFY